MINNKGNATILSVAVCMSLILIMSVIFEYIQMLIICNGIKNATESAIVSSIVANYDDTYSQLREGYSGGFTYVDTNFKETIDTGNMYARLDTLLVLTPEGDKHTKYKGAVKEYSISNLRCEFNNTEFAQGNADKNLNGIAMIDVEIPVRFGGRELVPIRFTMKVKAEYIPKF